MIRQHLISASLVLLCTWACVNCAAQELLQENSVFWEVSGNGLEKPSYILGSHHLFGSQYVDSLKNLNEKFALADAFVSEISFDSTLVTKTIAASIMRDSTLDQLLPPEWYSKTEDWLKEISIYPGLSVFNRFAPVTIEMIITSFLQTEINGPVQQPMDMYLEKRARSEGKAIFALESAEKQLNTLFHSIPYRRQAEQLIELVRSKEQAKEELMRMNQLYISQNLRELKLMGTDKFSAHELNVLLYDRNNAWIEQLPEIFAQHSAFVTVGALHLAGDQGLIGQLRRLGYTVTPLSLN